MQFKIVSYVVFLVMLLGGNLFYIGFAKWMGLDTFATVLWYLLLLTMNCITWMNFKVYE